MKRSIKNTSKILPVLLALFVAKGLFAQNAMPASDMEIYIGPNDPAMLDQGSDITEVELQVSLSVLLSDTNNVAKLHVNFGQTKGATDILEAVFTYDELNPAGGYTYTRNGQEIILGLGNHSNLSAIYYEVKIEDTAGNISEALQHSLIF